MKVSWTPVAPADCGWRREAGEVVVQPPVSRLSSVQVAREGIEPTNNHEGLSFAALPVCVPRRGSL